MQQQQLNQTLVIDSLDLNKLKEYFLSKNGRSKYSDLFNAFRDLIGSDPNNDAQFHDNLNAVATKKIDENNDEWWSLKKKYLENSSSSNFFFNTFQKTKHNLSKIVSKKETSHQSKSSFKQQKDDRPLSLSSSTSSLSTTDQLSKNDENSNEKDSQEKLEQEITSNVKSVKEHAKKLNRLNTESELNVNKRQMSSSYLLKDQNKNKQEQSTKLVEIEPLDLSSNQTKPQEKEFVIACSKPDSYMEIARLLSKHPYLAQKKDPFNGYTCAHWACRHSNIDIIKLLASTLENDKLTNPRSIRINHLINSRTRAGYTCIHLAYIYGNSSNTSQLTQTLVQYGALSIPDYNGKLSMEYAVNSNDSMQIDPAERKPSLLDFTNDANLISKRGSVIVKQKEKENPIELNNDKKDANETKELCIDRISVESVDSFILMPPPPLPPDQLPKSKLNKPRMNSIENQLDYSSN